MKSGYILWQLVYAMVTRTHIKLLRSNHVDGWYHYDLYRKYLDQVIFVVVNNFNSNGICILGNDSRSAKVGCVSIEKNAKANEQSYNRTYGDNDEFAYPKIGVCCDVIPGMKF